MAPRTTTSVITACVVIAYLSTVETYPYFGITSRERIDTLLWEIKHFSFKDSNSETYLRNLCKEMKLHGEQKEMCGQTGVAFTLMKSIDMSIRECLHLFKDEKWNCPLHDDYRIDLLEKGFKETAFLHALSSASMVYTFASACMKGQLKQCFCPEGIQERWPRRGCISTKELLFEYNFTSHFLAQDNQQGKNIKNQVDQHNIRLGIKVAERYAKIVCRCHGITGACAFKSCWRQLAPFRKIGRHLKKIYTDAVRVDHNGSNLVSTTEEDMVYIDESPDFCLSSNFSDGTHSRFCGNSNTCQSLCCGRGYIPSNIVDGQCKCKIKWCCTRMNCTECTMEEKQYVCK